MTQLHTLILPSPGNVTPYEEAHRAERPLRLYKRVSRGAFSPLGSLAEHPPVPGLQSILSGPQFYLRLADADVTTLSLSPLHFSLPPGPHRPAVANIAVCRRRQRASLFCLAWLLPFIRTINKAESKHTHKHLFVVRTNSRVTWMSPTICCIDAP